jgi:hypothetical protein
MRRTQPQEEVKPIEPLISRLQVDVNHAYEFLSRRPTNKVTKYDLINYANDYQKKYGKTPTIPTMVMYFTTEEDKKNYIIRHDKEKI